MLKCLNLNISFDLDYSAGELRDLPLPVGWHYDSIRGYEVDVGVVDVLVDHGGHQSHCTSLLESPIAFNLKNLGHLSEIQILTREMSKGN